MDSLIVEPLVWNWHTSGYPKDAVNIMRPTKWGNPYTHYQGTSMAEFLLPTRAQCVTAYMEWIHLPAQVNLLEAIKLELRGKHLLCCCVPKSCHGSIILKIANQEPTALESLFG